jgi:hypothetical protein
MKGKYSNNPFSNYPADNSNLFPRFKIYNTWRCFKFISYSRKKIKGL